MAAVASGLSVVSLLNAVALSRGNLRGRRFIKRPLLSRPLHSVLEDRSDIHCQDWTFNMSHIKHGHFNRSTVCVHLCKNCSSVLCNICVLGCLVSCSDVLPLKLCFLSSPPGLLCFQSLKASEEGFFCCYHVYRM